MSADEAANAPEGMKMKPATGLPGLQFAITVSTLDCTGCGSCATVCPGMKGNKALVMNPIDTQLHEQKNFLYGYDLPVKSEVNEKFKTTTVKGSQFLQPLLEFSGACAGCGETPYAKVITQLYGDRMYIANATGCSSIWGGSSPSTPYTVNKDGQGPAWANSLFEDNAEYGYGMFLGVTARRNRLADIMKKFVEADIPAEWGLKEAAQAWLDGKDDAAASKAAAALVIPALEKAVLECGNCGCELDALYREALKSYDMLVKKSFWMFGGDGWAYDIGYGGLDHVIASGEDINIFVVDTEVYSNTGGQSSKATPIGASAKFADGGKKTHKKDLGRLMMTYPNTYVASVAMGANPNQLIKALEEAQNHKGPSIVIAYAPCVSHGIKAGMNNVQAEMKKAVDCGLWPLYRYNPDQAEKPFTLDYSEPSRPVLDFLDGEVRYSSLKLKFPETAELLFAQAQKDADQRYIIYKKLEKSYNEG
jgi:pyruvate-ferredoxin/flavodoxin oxidoreductase